eukprot:CAMPEP_0115544314 /NCGR_PEP_ID=MMETSP0271-20121206/92025_1 /TAXON_ID=71861 /ORGANISM="Scrippsiella trochoidea, Strain CCMP3099" /LENGTH=37 /DNA_ID= /DNA_START= /DNA_END= /DNA_ORIENTATION=
MDAPLEDWLTCPTSAPAGARRKPTALLRRCGRPAPDV